MSLTGCPTRVLQGYIQRVDHAVFPSGGMREEDFTSKQNSLACGYLTVGIG